MKPDLENEAAFIQLARACDTLEHYHLEHSNDMVTRFRGKSKGRSASADIYVVSDPEWKKKLADCVAPIMPQQRPQSLSGRVTEAIEQIDESVNGEVFG